MVRQILIQQRTPWESGGRWVVLLIVLALANLLVSCEPSGDSDALSTPTTPGPRVEQQAVDNLLQLYGQALQHEDIDRLQALLEPSAFPSTPAKSLSRQGEADPEADLMAFRQALSTTFRRQTITDHAILPHTIQVAPDRTQVAFVEVESVSDPLFLDHRSRVYHTTFTLARTATAETVRFRIRGVQRDGPLVEISTQGQVQADVRSRVAVTASQRFARGRVEIVEPTTGEVQGLRATEAGFEGSFIASERSSALEIRLYDTNGEVLEVVHPYRARRSGDRVVESIPGTEGTRLLALTLGPDGTVWTGGDRGATLYQVAPGATQATLIRPLLSDPAGRLEDLTLDALGRLHAVVFSPSRSGVIVQDQGVLCQTVNVLDATYPFQTATGQPSVSTRAVAAFEGGIWLLGSDAGVGQVTDGFQNGQCPATGVEVHYGPILRREAGQLPANTVPALEVSQNGALWIGSVLGLGRFQAGELTRVPFDPELSFQGDAATLEAFFQEVAQAIFEARPVESVALGEVSFVEAFGSALVKEDLIFSLAEDAQGHLWIGTLGGGVRRVEVRQGTVEQTVHLTRLDGLASNIVFNLAVGADGAIWAATDDGVSRIEAAGEAVAITTFTALDGLALPARDIAVDRDGTAWVATDGGLFRIQARSGQITGVVQDTADQPVESATILIHGTSVQTVTDAQGRFRVGGMAPGMYLLQAEGRQALSEAFAPAFREVKVQVGTQELAPIVLEPMAPSQPVNVEQGGVVVFPEVPGAALDIPPQTAQFPEGAAAAIGLTLLPLQALPRPLPSGFTGIVAAEMEPPGLSFTTPARLTLPTVGQLSPGDLLVLLCLDDTTGTYTPLGLGRVSGDGTVIENISGGVRHACTVVYARTTPDATRVFLLPVSGNNQRAEPGEELPEPLVVRLEDQFGNPITQEPLTADILQGEGSILETAIVTDARGQAEIRVQVGPSEADLIVQVRSPDLPSAQPVHFFSIVGELDTPDIPRDLAIAGDDIILVADRFTGLLVLDIRNPAQPVHLHTLPPSDAVGNEEDELVSSLTIRDAWAYLGIGFPAKLYIVDLTDPRHPDFAADNDGDRTVDVIRAILNFPGDVQGHSIRDLAIQNHIVYALSNTLSGSTFASLYIVDVQEPTQPQLVNTVPLPTGNPTGIMVVNNFLYVAAETTGLLTFDLSDPTLPTLVHTLGDPDPQDHLDVTLTSTLVTEGDQLYVVETQGQATAEPRDYLVVIDLSNPARPRRQGRIQITTKPQLSLFSRGLAVAPPFAYVARGFFGLEALDIRDPEAPRRVGFVPTPSEALQVITSGDFVYVTDQLFGLQVIQGPTAAEGDTDGDGIVDFFDAFPTDPLETQDTDGDRLGNHADADDDNDSFSDAEEAAAMPPTDPLDPLSFPIRVPPPGVNTLVVDATSQQSPRERIGTAEAPYRSVTEAIRAVHSGLLPDVETVQLRPGTYSPLLTQEVIPLDFGRLSHLTVQAASPGTAILDGEFRGDVINAEFSHNLLLEGLVVKRGAIGISVLESTNITLRNNHCLENTEDGIRIGINTNTNIVVSGNLLEANERTGILILGNAAATVTRNIMRSNGVYGIFVGVDSTADITDNLSERNGSHGIMVFANSSATISRNVSQHNSNVGIIVVTNSTATIIENTSSFNTTGIGVDVGSTADIRNNTTTDTIQTNDRNGNGIIIAGGSEATISGGLIARSQRHGIIVRVSPFTPEPISATAQIGLDRTTVLEISDNGGAGLFVADDGSSAEIDSRNLVFRNNAEGDVVGNVTDVAP